MDLNNITMDDLKAKFAAFDKKHLIKFGMIWIYNSFYNYLLRNFKSNG